ncbi:MAG: tetratricopeptide repeat protein [Betaproteobacteria bacterium]
MPDLPSATLTFLFTDIEGSTKLWETEPVRMADALERHDVLCRGVVDDHGGRLIKMIGDGLHAVFVEPEGAVAATLELQRGMAAIAADSGLPFRMRCGLHAGSSQERDGDYFGSEVNRAARIMNAAHGGQILLSQSVVDLGRARLAKGMDLLHLGRVRLRDLAAPQDVWQLLHADLQRTFPALRSLDSTPNNLPQQTTSFIGREKEVVHIRELMGNTRLLTLTGSGGCGKTRLAIQVAADLLESHSDGVWLVEFAALADPGLVPQAVATVLGLREDHGKTLTQSLTEHLKSRQVMLVLDNAEHVLTACAQLADALLRDCPQLRLLVSSREALGIGGELSYRIPSLSIPDPKQDAAPERLAQFESVRLFIERARSQQPQFTLTPHNAQALASVCARLDGIPLAIELAAARVRSLSMKDLNERLDQRFRLLTGGSRTALPRQQTLRSAIDWSYDLLNASEKSLYGRLAVFVGGWTLEAAERVCASDGITEEDVFDLLSSLVDKNLVMAEERESSSRYRLLESMRQYARDRLLESGGGDQWRNRHLAHFVAFAEAAAPHLAGAEEQEWLDRLETEHDNLRSALVWSATPGGEAAGGLRMAGALYRFWYVRGHLGEGRRWFTELLADVPLVRDAARAMALNGAGVLAWQQADSSEAHTLFQESLAIWRELGNRRGISDALGNLGMIAYNHGDYPTARTRLEECLAIKRELGEQRGIAGSMINLGAVASEQGDYAAARSLYEQSLAIFRNLGDRRGVATLLTNLGNMALSTGDNRAARQFFNDGLEIQRQLADRSSIAVSLNNLGRVARQENDLDAARLLVEESLTIRREIAVPRGIAESLSDLGNIAFDQGDIATARALQRESLAIRRDVSDRWGIAVSLEGLGVVALALAKPYHAARVWGAAEVLRKEIGTPLTPAELSRFDGQVAAARARLGAAAFDRAMQEGRAMTLEQAVQCGMDLQDD